MSNESVPAAGGKIYPAIIAIMRAVGPIAKDSKNQSQGYNFRGIDAVYNAVHPHFSEHGVFSASKVLDSRHEFQTDKNGKPYHLAILTMRFTFYAEDGSSVDTEVVGEGQDYSGDKASNKAMSVADKYAILQLLKIPTAMVDPDRPVEHDNPQARPGARSATPRSERSRQQDDGPPTIISQSVLNAIKKEWAEVYGEEVGDRSKYRVAFAEWCGKVCNDGPWNPESLAEWTQSRLDAVNAKLPGGESP